MADFTGVSETLRSNSGWIGSIALIVFLVAILYVVYTYLYPGDDPTFTQFLKGEADARKAVHVKGNVPAIYTGGDFTFSFWIYVDDWNYRASLSKFLFSIGPQTLTPTSQNVLVGMLAPLQNGMMIRASTTSSSGGSTGTAPMAAPSGPPDITVESQLSAVMTQQSSTTMFQTSLETPCDIKEVPLQRWVCITIVSSGRVLDVYMDGRLSRSCVLDNTVYVPRGPLSLRLGSFGGFGGRYSSVQMWNQQLTPDVIYGIYMMGPTQAKHNVVTDITKYLNLNVSFTGSAPGEPIYGGAGPAPPSNPFAALSQTVQSGWSTASSDASAMYQRL
jgi:hypothetical protein